MVDSFMFNEKNDILTAVADERLLVWYYLNALYVDKELMDLCKTTKDSTDIQRMGQILSFT
jgi:intraflagellar transport protein 80